MTGVNGNKGDHHAAFAFGRDRLGPAIAGYLSRLYAQISAFESEYGARTLFVSRAGVRIRRALDAFVKARNLTPPANAEYFWISRLVVARGVWNRNPEAALDVLTKEFRDVPLPEFVRSMFRFAPAGARLNPVEPALQGTGSDLRRFMKNDSQMATVVRTLFRHQAGLFETYVAQLLERSDAALLVDTGWQATAQTLLAKAFPEREWWGAYFGRVGGTNTDRSEWHRAQGIVFEADAFDRARPETCTILNRHLIEHLFEPSAPSVQWYVEVEKGRVIAPDAEAILADAPTPESAPMYAGVMSHLEGLTPGIGVAELRRREAAAWHDLARTMMHPTDDELALFASVTRSADFGRDVRVPLLPPPVPRFDGDTHDLRVKESLWPCGQAALEYPSDVARALQKRLAGGAASEPAPDRRTALAAARPAVAIITRTLDRPMFLERALSSVASQTYRDYLHVVVNDGGDNDIVNATIERANCDQARVRLVDAVHNRGMEAASNLAIRNSDSDYVVIHDDDDTWEPDFLKKTVAFLDGKEGRLYGGVITKTTYCSEEVTPTGIVVHERKPYNGWVQNVHLVEMAIGNFFAPIAFLFRRELWERLGGFNELYPVLGDWDFNLRFLVEADIGVVPEALANYHHRDRGDVTTFGNSVIAGRDKHLEFSSVVRNNLVRSLVQRGHAAAATLAGVGLYFADQRNTLRSTDGRLAQLGARVATGGTSPWTDQYWVALQQVVAAVATGDGSLIEEIRREAAGQDRSAFGLSKSWSLKSQPPVPATASGIERATAALLKRQDVRPGPGGRAVATPPDFDEKEYLRQNPDVASAVANGTFASGYEHYLAYGRHENRTRPRRQQ